MDFVVGGSGPLIVGHSWVSKLKNSGLLPDFFSCITVNNGTFADIIGVIGSIPLYQEHDYVFVFLGSSELDLVTLTQIENSCQELATLLRIVFPHAKLIFSQIEERFEPLTGQINNLWKARSNSYNRWLNTFHNKDALFRLKGQGFFGLPFWYAPDGISLNQAGLVKLAALLKGYYTGRLAG